MHDSDTAQQLRQALVEGLKKRGELVDSFLEAALLAVPRHAFLPELPLEQAYADEAVPVKRDPDGNVISSASQPTMIAMMLRQLRLAAGDNVLEIGAGTGYNAALMRHIVGEEGNVTTVELDKDIAALARNNLQRAAVGSNVRVVEGDGAAGYAPRASYDRIIATVGVWDIPSAWFKQLKPKGIIVTPIWIEAGQVSAAFTAQADGTFFSRVNLPCGFIQLRGLAAGPNLYLRIGSSSLILTSNDIAMLDSAALHLLLSEDAEEHLIDPRLSTTEYNMGFVPYLTLNVPPGFVFAAFSVPGDQQAYGISNYGFALLASGSACFVPLTTHGQVHCFGALDALMAVQEALSAWNRSGRPDSRRVRLRLTPIGQPQPLISGGRLFRREDHYLHVWQDT